MSKGYSMLSKELMDSEEYFSERFTRMQAYIDLCLLAAWKDRKFIKRGQVVELKAGQLAKSEEELAERWKWSRNTVRKYLNEQQIIGNIEQRKSRLITIVTVKFGLNIAQQIEQQISSKTAQQIEQQQEDIENNKEKENNTPYNPPAGDGKNGVSLEEFEKLKKAFEALSDENKKLKEEKEKYEKKKKSVFTPPTEKEVADYIKEKGYHFDATSFVSFYQSKGWMVGKTKMKDWKAACKTWEGKRKPTKDDGYDDSSLTRAERFANWATQNCPHICDMEMPNDEQLEDMLRMCNNDIIGCLDLLQDDHHTGSLYDLFKERFGSNR